MHRLVIAFIVLLLGAVPRLYAAPAIPDPMDLRQPDGTSFKAKKLGDEFQSWLVSTDTGHTVIKNEARGEWEYAEANPDGTLKPSGVRVFPNGINAPGFIQKGIRPPRNTENAKELDDMIRKKLHKRKAAAAVKGGAAIGADGSIGSPSPEFAAAVGDWAPVPVSGTRKLLIVLVNFANRSLTTTAAGWNGTIFDTTPGALSVANFYADNSFGTLTISPATHTQPGNPQGIVTVTVADNHPNSGNAYNYANETTILNHALAQAASYVDFASFDQNIDNVLDQEELSIYFIYAGYEDSGSNKTPKIWAHAWGGSITAGTKTVTRWALNGELNDSDVQHPMGVIAHELGHALCGLPDLYDTYGYNAGLGTFSLMASGSWGADTAQHAGTTPVSLDAWSREYLGWSTPVIPSSNGAMNLGTALSSDAAVIKLINDTLSSTQYFLAENRYPEAWDKGMRRYLGAGWGGGLLITHVDIASGTQGSNDINRYVSGGHQGVMAEQASTAGCNMVTTSCPGAASTLYYGGNNGNFNNSTVPNSKYYSGASSFRNLDNISVCGSTMTLTFSQGGSAPNGSIKINAGAVYARSLSVTLNLLATVAAPSTVKEMRFSNDGSSWNAWEPYLTTKTWSLAAGSDGERAVYVQFRDAGGNDSITYSDTITLDTTSPDAVIVVNGGLANPTKATSVSFVASNSDVVVYKYKMDSGSWSGEIPVTTTVNYTGLITGNHTLSLIGKDAAGNWQPSAFPATISWTVDATKPVTTASPSGGNYAVSQSVTLTSGEAATIYYSTNGTTPTTASSQYSGPVSITATTTLKFFAVDNLGNVETVKSQVYNLPPTSTVTGVATVTKLTTATLTVGGTGVTTYKYTLDNGVESVETPIATKISLNGLSAGAHTVSVIGKNSLGLWQSTPTTVSWTVEQAVPVTTASLADGVYSPNQTVTLSANEAGTIYYTLNGTTPTTASAKYSVPLSIKANTTLKFFAVDLAGNAEAVKTRSYTITTVTGAPPALTKLTGATLTVGGTGVTAYKYALDGGAAGAETPVTTKIALAGLANGAHTVTVLGKRGDGTWQVTPTAVSWTVDTQAPVTTASPAGGTYASSQTVTLTADETATIYYTTTGATPTTASAKYTAPLTVTLPKTLKFFAVDSAGNVEAVKTQLYLPPPVATVTGAPAAVTKLTSATLAVGGVGITHYKYTLDSGTESAELPIATKIVLFGLSNGSHTVTVVGKNGVGTWQDTGTTKTWTVDTQAPTTTASVPGGTYAAAQTVTLSASEAATIYYTTNGTTPTTASAKYTGALSIPTTMTLKYFAVDTAGNAETVKTQVYSLPPTAVLTGTPSSTTKQTNAIITVGGVTVVAYKYTLDNGVESVETPIATKISLSGLSAGAHTVSVIGKNSLGLWQSTPTTVSWTVEQAVPVTTASLADGVYSPNQTVTLSANEAGTIYYTLNGTTPTTASAKYSVPLSIKANTTLKFFAVDLAGNAEAVKTRSYTITTVTGTPPALTKLTGAALTVGGTGVTAYKYALDGGAASAETLVATKIVLAGLANGAHTVTVLGKKADGTWQVTPTAVSWTVDTQAPVTTASPAGGTYASSQTVTLTADETATIYYTTNGATPTTASPKYTAPLTVALPKTLKFFAVDGAGNVEAVKTQLYLPPPVATVTGAPAAVTKLTSATLAVGGVGITHYKYTLDSGTESAELPIATKIVLSGLSHGSHTVTVVGKNGVGTWQDTGTTKSWPVDTQAPTTTVSVLGGTYAAPQTVTLSASEAATIYYTTNGTVPTTASAKYTGALSVPTTMTLKYFAVDTAGNAETVKAQIYSLPPTATISGIPDTASPGAPVTFTVGGSYVTVYKYSLDNSAWSYESSVTATRTLGGVSAGTHTLKVVGKNAAGTWQDDLDATARVWTVN